MKSVEMEPGVFEQMLVCNAAHGGADLIRQALAAGLAGEVTIIIGPGGPRPPASAWPAGSASPWNSSTSEHPGPRSRLSPATA
jgi:hypothetical protein